jgi:hypothetical protein
MQHQSDFSDKEAMMEEILLLRAQVKQLTNVVPSLTVSSCDDDQLARAMDLEDNGSCSIVSPSLAAAIHESAVERFEQGPGRSRGERCLDLPEIMKRGFSMLIEEGDTREIGKQIAYPAEKIIAKEWLEFVCNIKTVDAPDDNQGQQEKYDRLSSNKVRIQIKYRGGNALHMEQTRRTTGKNAENGASNGQVRYSIKDFDVIVFIIPDGSKKFETIENWKFLAVPIFELEDPKMPGYCVRGVPAPIKKEYTGKARDVVMKMEREYPLMRGAMKRWKLLI